MNEDNFNMAVRKFLKEVGVTSQGEIERVVREGKVEGSKLKLRMTLTAIGWFARSTDMRVPVKFAPRMSPGGR